MRDFLLKIVIIADDVRSAIEVSNSLRFSTHCKIISVIRNISTSDIIFYNNIKYIDHTELNVVSNVIQEADLVFNLSKNNIHIFKKQFDKIVYDYQHRLNSLPSDPRIIDSSHESYITLKNLIQNISCDAEDMSCFRILFDYVNDFASNTKLIGSCIRISNQNENFISLVSDKLSKSLSEILLPIFDIEKNFVHFQISISFKDSFESFSIERTFSYNHWSLFRAIGINIPLVLIQNQLKREFDIVPMVNNSDIFWSQKRGCPRYALEYDIVYVDLDETLIIDGVRVKDVYDFIIQEKKRGKQIRLITRHKNNIFDTLRSVNIEKSLFSDVIKVNEGELKSSFINGKSIFIDNEFPERLDVRKNLKLPVLDLNQLEFFLS